MRAGAVWLRGRAAGGRSLSPRASSCISVVMREKTYTLIWLMSANTSSIHMIAVCSCVARANNLIVMVVTVIASYSAQIFVSQDVPKCVVVERSAR